MEKSIDVGENALKATTAGPVRNTGLGFRSMANVNPNIAVGVDSFLATNPNEGNQAVSDTPIMDAVDAKCDELGVMDAICYAVCEGQKLEIALNEANERIKRMESDAISAAISAKWMWMMNYCKTHGFSPTLGWESAEKAWTAAFEVKEAKP